MQPEPKWETKPDRPCAFLGTVEYDQSYPEGWYDVWEARDVDDEFFISDTWGNWAAYSRNDLFRSDRIWAISIVKFLRKLDPSVSPNAT